MKLIVKWLHKGPYSGPALFDENGELLPGQKACAVEGAIKQLTEVTVTFVADGNSVVIERDDDAER